MKQFEPLALVEAGTLERPGPIGRLLRLALGLLCLYALWAFIRAAEAIVVQPFSSLDNLAVAIAVQVCLFNYVVNIGFGRSWGRRPLIISLAALALAAGAGFLAAGSLDNPVFGVPLLVWLGYFYAHLGISFVLAALAGTPGCEMRSIPETVGRLRGQAVHEHRCPAAFIAKIDAWERRLRHP